MRISILTPSFNSAAYLERALKSVNNQNYSDWEHIVVDGNSSDGTVDLLKKYPNINWISEPDKGQSDAMNKAFRMSTGEIIGYLNADDAYEPNIFQLISEEFMGNPDVDIIVGNLIRHSQSNEVVYCPEVEYEKILLHFKYRFPINPVCYFYRRRVQENIHPFPLKNHYAMDYWFLLKALKKYRVKKVDKVFGHFYLYGTNKTDVVNSVKECRKTVLQHTLRHDWKGLITYSYHFLKAKYLG